MTQERIGRTISAMRKLPLSIATASGALGIALSLGDFNYPFVARALVAFAAATYVYALLTSQYVEAWLARVPHHGNLVTALVLIAGGVTFATVVPKSVPEPQFPVIVQTPPPPPTAAEIAAELAKALPKSEAPIIKPAAVLPPPNIALVERDPESWGHRYGTPLIFDRSTKFRMPIGTLQRFNPQLGNPKGLSEAVLNVFAFINFPDRDLEVAQIPAPWQITESNRPNTVTYYARFGDLNQGTRASAPVREAWYIKALVPRTFEIRWNITGIGQRFGSFPPIQGGFEIEAFTP